MLHKEIVAVFVSENRKKKHTNALCGQNLELLNIQLVGP